jgi:outer membrane receptor for monomeric catechols
VLIDNENNVDATANYYTNGDFTTVNGFEFTLRTRRINRLQTFASYTYSDARGVNSDPNSNAGNLNQSMLSPPPMMINPLYYTNSSRRSFC